VELWQWFRRARGTIMPILVVCTRAFLSQQTVGVSAIVANGEGQVLLGRSRLAGGWALPGGGVDAFEPPETAVIRELREEIGLEVSAAPQFIGLYTRRVLWATNLIAVYCVRDARFVFKPNLEISEIRWIDPAKPPPGTHAGTMRRLAEFAGLRPRSPYW
jgi:8-oxo-dGTP diphosphatase